MKYILIYIITIAASFFITCGNPESELDETLPNEVDSRVELYFEEDYLSSRNSFLISARKIKNKFPDCKISSIVIPTKDDINFNYTIDYLYIPARLKNEKTLILSSGIHGAEAFVGAAMQRHFLEEIYPAYVDSKNTGILIIHSINPWGFHNVRRGTENNVDLNRNFGNSTSLFKTKNDGYPLLYDLLNPDGKANTRSIANIFFPIRAIYNILMKGMATLRQSILQGQYEFPRGIYFGGQDFEPLRKPLDKLIIESIGNSNKVLFIDLHTGYGERGVLHLFPSDPKDVTVKEETEKIFQGYQIDWASNEDFYSVTGELSTHICELIPNIKICVPMVFEYGTLNSHTTSGAIESIHRTILENQGYWNGYEDEEEKLSIQEKYREMFYPSSKRWKTKILLDTEKIWKDLLKEF
ncbi:M14 family metallopeptidase [Leptospira sp. GIMC2001]|uniref:M14 family metallopeptidase n=1 Tax=Leptospira sp. GIMC2001 TaxID=1513297 RepID=UPI00234A7051|nr:M14 family metallopeptidase [Leptospira sp. GIMC2001]WCL49107.1 M14 family metallopeptidase [Leptospira sp. GIMC2001]